jgi:hypothetical protein
MDTTLVEKKFGAMGARAKISTAPMTHGNPRPFSIDIRRDQEGEFFDIKAKKEIEMMILDVQKKDRHLLLLIKDHSTKTMRDPEPEKSRFLCGHDERNWFTCAVPEGASSVFQAKQALKPKILRDIEANEGLKTSRAHKRHRKLDSGKKIHRQGEFMFIPEEDYQPPKNSLTIIHRHEPMSRGGGNSHFAEYLYRSGGVSVHMGSYNSQSRTVGLTDKEFEEVMKKDPNAKLARWESRVRDPQVYVKGKITHKEHRTLDLGSVWHKVLLNTENRARGFGFVAFID